MSRLDFAPKLKEIQLTDIKYAADPRFVVEGSVQVPIIRNTGPLVLRTDVNVLLGVKYLF